MSTLGPTPLQNTPNSYYYTLYLLFWLTTKLGWIQPSAGSVAAPGANTLCWCKSYHLEKCFTKFIWPGKNCQYTIFLHDPFMYLLREFFLVFLVFNFPTHHEEFFYFLYHLFEQFWFWIYIDSVRKDKT